MDPYRIEQMIYSIVVFAKRVDTHPFLPFRTDQIKRIVHEMEFTLESSDEEQFWEGRDPHIYLAHLDTATGGWHRS
jgi:hypothetical protein